jgi:hypothetical protein
MSFSFRQKIGRSFFVMIFSLPIYAQMMQQSSDRQIQCTDFWMLNSDDNVKYKYLGEEYCGCLAKQNSVNSKTVRLCLSRTLLQDAMESLDEDIGLSKANDSDIYDYCLNNWNLIYPKQSEHEKKLIHTYCECTQPNILNLIKQSTNITDTHYVEGINTIADECSSYSVIKRPNPAK